MSGRDDGRGYWIVTADGQVRSCLFSTTETDLRGLLHGDADDETLARKLQGGDRAALDHLVRRYLRPVHAVVASFLAEPVRLLGVRARESAL